MQFEQFWLGTAIACAKVPFLTHDDACVSKLGIMTLVVSRTLNVLSL